MIRGRRDLEIFNVYLLSTSRHEGTYLKTSRPASPNLRAENPKNGIAAIVTNGAQILHRVGASILMAIRVAIKE